MIQGNFDITNRPDRLRNESGPRHTSPMCISCQEFPKSAPARFSQLGRSFSARIRYWPQVREVGCLGYCVCLGLRSASESPCSACLTPYTQTCPACLPVLLCLLYVVLLFRMLSSSITPPPPPQITTAPARFGCKQRKACNNTGVGYGGAVSTRSGGTPVRTVRAELACLSLSAARSGALLLKGPSSTEHWFPGSNLRSSKHPKL